MAAAIQREEVQSLPAVCRCLPKRITMMRFGKQRRRKYLNVKEIHRREAFLGVANKSSTIPRRLGVEGLSGGGVGSAGAK